MKISATWISAPFSIPTATAMTKVHGLYTDLRDTDAGLQYLYDNGLKLKVTGIIRPNEDTSAPMLSGSIAYTSDLTKYVIEHSKESDAITAQKDSHNTDIFTGLPFKDSSGSTDRCRQADCLSGIYQRPGRQRQGTGICADDEHSHRGAAERFRAAGNAGHEHAADMEVGHDRRAWRSR